MIPALRSQSTLSMARIQRSFIGVWVAMLLVGGLVSVPTTCECGAGIAHGHSLFILPGHNHTPHGQQHEGHGAGPDTTQHFHVETMTHGGPQLAEQVIHGSDRIAVAIATGLATSNSWQRFRYPDTAIDPGDGRNDTPDAPPPQQPG